METVKNQKTGVYYVKYNGQIEQVRLFEINNVKMLCLFEHPDKIAPIPIDSPSFGACTIDEVVNKFDAKDLEITNI